MVLAFSNAVPRTAWIPKQVEGGRRKLEARRMRERDDVGKDGEGKGLWEKLLLVDGQEERESKESVKSVAIHLGLYAEFWDKYLGGMGGPPMGLVRRRYERWRREVEADDEILRSYLDQGGSIKEMEEQEVILACEKRGISVREVEESHLRAELEKWLQKGEKASRQ